ncbi:dihydroneopterin aldolase [Coccomyxa subellipsoidea C-169]|uniref:7,8-dihydroneopterin aldolase n=1 Tax=Coccomyxa subellipsoidea (strain C-169) TaxID=574566 RepID=I0YR57_COCSC|nr:dihydroneopterin aldolase [Coccomyxa subellipsoidea C-169]EIE20876.1 dihydroneopterin aldolase [Coccomyxa subellipsoidea C-169]|eukprot:XP_005645420.1 dihydroneopterin aldolase [Coccomyxa subellipsoidea C-169]
MQTVVPTHRRYATGVIVPGIPAGPDKIHLNGLVFHGYHGVLPEENKLGQKFVVDAQLFCDLQTPGLSDELVDTVDYAAVYKDIKLIMEGKPHKLLESVAEDIAGTVLQDYEKVLGIKIKIQKPQVAIEGVVKYLGVEVERYRHDHDDIP